MKKLFENTERAFALKSNAELERAYFLFKLISKESLVKIGTLATKVALGLHLPVEGLIRASVFDHFCGGINEEDCLSVVEKLYSANVHSVLDYSVEGKDTEDPLDYALSVVLKVLNFVSEKESISFAVFKPSGFGRFKLLKKVNQNIPLTEDEKAEWGRVITRFEKACQSAHDKNVPVLIDAEESWIQDAADSLVLEMMRKFNKEKAIVFNTLQFYRHDRKEYMQKLKNIAKEEGFKIGIKPVRGAYIEKENQRAIDKGYPTPICKDKATTDLNFNEGVSYMINHLDLFSIFAGTHNEESCYLIIDQLKRASIPNGDKRVWFGQLYGMSDQISFNLADQGYNVAKYLPFGPVRDVMPYLIRRAEENTSVAGQTSRELSLISEERKRRKLN